jgi:outer membrane protein assembly factor BamB
MPKPARPEQFLWAYPDEPPSPDEAVPLLGAPAVDSAGRIYLHLQGRLVALEERDGHPRVCWDYVTDSHAPGPLGAAPDGTLRLHCSDGCLHCISFEGKQVYWPVAVGEPLGYAAPIADADGNTWLSAFDGGLLKIDAQGTLQQPGRYFRSRQKFDSAGIIYQGVLYIGSEDGYLFAIRLDEDKGTSLWDHAAGQGCTGWYIHSSPAGTSQRTIVLAGCDEHLYGFDQAGKTAWKTHMPGQMLASPVIDCRGQIYVGISQSQRGQEPRGVLACVDGNSHKIRWEYQATGPVESTPVVGDDEIVYFGDNAGVIHAVDFQGKPRWTAQVESPVRSAGTILAPGRLAFGLDNETLIVLRCSSGGLAKEGWPKIGRTLGQCGMA